MAAKAASKARASPNKPSNKPSSSNKKKHHHHHRHPLQRLSSPSRGYSLIVHILGLSSFSASYWYLVQFPTHINASYGWHWQYLTIIGLALATATFAVGLLADLTLSPGLFALKNSLSFCSAPLEVLIAVLYWGISAVDRTLVVPPEIYIDPLADVGFHAMPAILLTIDLLFLSPPYLIAGLPSVAISTSIAFAYWGWVEQCYRQNGWYPYPLFGLLTTNQRILLFGTAALTMSASTMVLKWLYSRVNGTVGDKRPTPANLKGE